MRLHAPRFLDNILTWKAAVAELPIIPPELDLRINTKRSFLRSLLYLWQRPGFPASSLQNVAEAFTKTTCDNHHHPVVWPKSLQSASTLQSSSSKWISGARFFEPKHFESQTVVAYNGVPDRSTSYVMGCLSSVVIQDLRGTATSLLLSTLFH